MANNLRTAVALLRVDIGRLEAVLASAPIDKTALVAATALVDDSTARVVELVRRVRVARADGTQPWGFA